MDRMKLYDELAELQEKLLAFYEVEIKDMKSDDIHEYRVLLLGICWIKCYLIRKELEP